MYIVMLIILILYMKIRFNIRAIIVFINFIFIKSNLDQYYYSLNSSYNVNESHINHHIMQS